MQVFANKEWKMVVWWVAVLTIIKRLVMVPMCAHISFGSKDNKPTHVKWLSGSSDKVSLIAPGSSRKLSNVKSWHGIYGYPSKFNGYPRVMNHMHTKYKLSSSIPLGKSKWIRLGHTNRHRTNGGGSIFQGQETRASRLGSWGSHLEAKRFQPLECNMGTVIWAQWPNNKLCWKSTRFTRHGPWLKAS